MWNFSARMPKADWNKNEARYDLLIVADKRMNIS